VKIWNNSLLSKHPITPEVCRYTTLWISVLKGTTENKTSSVTTHFKKLTTTTCLLSQLLSTVLTSNVQQQCVCFAAIDDALLKCVVREVVSFSIVAKTLTFHKVVRCRGIFSDSILLQIFSCMVLVKCLKIDQYLMRLRRTKKVCQFFGPSCRIIFSSFY